MTRSIFIVLIAALALNLGATLAQASCRMQTLAEQAQRADVVAYGQVNGSSFRIERIFKGQAGGTVQVRFGETPGAITSVDYMASNGGHTLYVRRDGAGYATNACSGSHPGAPTDEEISYFGSGTATSGSSDTGISVSGVALDRTAAAVIALAGLGLMGLLAIGALRVLARRAA